MGSTNFTTHYDIPLPLGSDKTTPMDYNESMQTVDTALFEAHGNAASAVAGLEITNGNVAQNADDIDALEGRMTTAEGTLVTQGNAITNLGLDVADVRTDGQDMICAYKEADAQADRGYSVGDFFIYNDVLYKATQSIAIGDTIVPDTNCTTTNMTTEIAETNNSLENYFTNATALFTGSIHGGTDITLEDNINNYHAFSIIDNNADNEATQSINVKYKSNTYPSIIASIVDYNDTAGALVLADIALTTSDGVHYHCARSVQWNLDGNGISYFSTDQTTNITIMGYN